MYFLGLDTGYARLGVGIVEVKKGTSTPQASYYNLIETPMNKTDSQRLVSLEEQLSSLLKKFQIKTCALESFFFKKDSTTATQLLQARGVILLVLEKNNIPVISISPTRVKKFITGYGKANKIQIQTMIKKILRLAELPQPDDVADALGLGLCAWLSTRTGYAI